MRPTSSWRAIRLEESRLERDLRRRHRLWLHGACIGLLVALAMGLVAFLLASTGWESLALRYLVTVGFGYGIYLLVIRAWAAHLVGERRSGSSWDGVDLPTGSGGPGSGGGLGDAPRAPFSSGHGGDFGGGGASASFDAGGLPDASAAADMLDAASSAGDIAGGVAEVAAGADDAAVVVLPVLAVFLFAAAVLAGVGIVMLFFGSDVLLAAAIELAFAYTAARTAGTIEREGWLRAAVRHTWKPMLGAVLCAVLLGAAIDTLLPQAHTLPEAVRMLRGVKP